MADYNTNVADKGANQGDPGDDTGDDQSVDNKTDATDNQAATDQQGGEKDKSTDNETGRKSLLDGKEEEEVKEDDKPTEAPEKYDDFAIPEGFTMNEIALEGFTPLAKEAGMNQENAQKMIDLFVKVQNDTVKAADDQFNEESDRNVASIKSDNEIGGDNFSDNIKIANRVISSFGNKDVRDALTQSGLGNHPEIVRMFLKIGNAMGEDSFVDSHNQTDTTEKTFAERLYPNKT